METSFSARGGKELDPNQERIKQLGLRMYESYRHHDHPYTHYSSIEIPYQGILWVVRYWPKEGRYDDKLEIIRDSHGSSESPAMYTVDQDGGITKNERILIRTEYAATYDPDFYEEVTNVEEAQMLRTITGWVHALRRVDL